MNASLRLRDERGETLVETLMTVSIMGIAFVSILFGVAAVYLGVGVYRQDTNAELLLRDYAETIENPVVVPYEACTTKTPTEIAAAYEADVATSGFALPSNTWSADVTGVTFWDGASRTTPAFSPTCPGIDRGIQQLTLQVASPPGPRQATQSVVIVKRAP